MVIATMVCCKQVYQPSAVKSNPGYLVVDGSLIIGADTSFITLSRTRNLDSVDVKTEEDAKVVILGPSAETIPLAEFGNGRYGAAHLTLDFNKLYQLKITTADGREYLSDSFPVKQTPLLDSITWAYDTAKSVKVYAYSHDVLGATKYYRWDYVETWEYHTAYQSLFDLIDNQPVFRGPDKQIYYCWKNFYSSDIIVANTTKLSSDIINQQLIETVTAGSEKIGFKYSILVNEYAITEEAFAYWQSLKKNTEQLGTLFDVQPTQQVNGNIHCISNPNEPVIGFIAAGTMQQKRIFISNDDLPYWNYVAYYSECFTSPQAHLKIGMYDVYEYLERPRHTYTLLAPEANLFEIAENYCADCREHGGATIKPSFWP